MEEDPEALGAADTVLPDEPPDPSEAASFGTADTLDSGPGGALLVGGSVDTERITEEQAGRYTEGEELGRGGIGRVCVAFDAHLGREVARKELLARLGTGTAPSPQSLARFLREARVTGQLEHPGIVPVHELGRKPDGTLYYTMKLVRGESLTRALRKCADLDARLRLLGHVRDLCEAIAYAHSRGAVHRDLKPDNVMVGAFGETVVVDWGLAKIRGASDLRSEDLEAHTRWLREQPASPSQSARPLDSGEGDAAHTLEGSTMGTPAYMSPEQARGDVDAMDERTDVWGLGAILFEVLTGRAPYAGKSAFDVLSRVLVQDPPPVRELCPEAPPELAAIADRALTRDPDGRYASAAEIAEEIAAWQDGRRVGAYEYTSWELVRRFAKRNRAATVAALVTLLGALLATVLVWRSYRTEQAERARAEEQRVQAEAAERRAEDAAERARRTLAEALLGEAERQRDEGDSGASALYAAGALAQEPNLEAPDEASRERIVRALSRYVEATRSRAHEFAGRLGHADLALSSRGAFTSDGRFVATVFGEGFAVFDLDDEDRRATPRVQAVEGARGVWGVTADGGVLLVAGERSGVYDLRSGGQREAWDATARTAVEQGGAIVIGHADGTLQFGPRRWPTPLPSADRLAWSPDGRRVAVASRGQGRVAVLELATGRVLFERVLPAAVQSLAFSPSGEELAVGGQHPRVWVLDPAGAIRRSFPTSGWVGGLVWPRAERLYASEGGERITVRDPSLGRVQESVRVPASSGFRLAVGPATATGRWLAAVPARGPEADLRVTLLRPRRATAALDPGVPVRTFASRGGVAAVLSADGVRVLSAGKVTFWPLPADAAQPVSVVLAEGPSLALLTARGALFHSADVSGPATPFRALAPAWSERSQALLGLAFAEEGRVVHAAGPAGEVLRVDVESGALTRRDDHEGVVFGLAVHQELVASASQDGRVCLRDAGGVMHLLEGHGGLASDVAFSPDGERLASVDGVGVLRLWDVRTGRRLAQVEAHERWINRVAWSGSGRLVASASDDGSVRVWRVGEDAPALHRIFPTGTLALGVGFEDDVLHYHDADRVHTTPLDATETLGDPTTLQTAAEQAAGLRLVGLELRPLD